MPETVDDDWQIVLDNLPLLDYFDYEYIYRMDAVQVQALIDAAVDAAVQPLNNQIAVLQGQVGQAAGGGAGGGQPPAGQPPPAGLARLHGQQLSAIDKYSGKEDGSVETFILALQNAGTAFGWDDACLAAAAKQKLAGDAAGWMLANQKSGIQYNEWDGPNGL